MGETDISYIYNVNEETFDRLVLEHSRTRPVVVDFWAEWCSPCRILNPVLERVAHRFEGNIALAEVEVDDNMHLAGHYKLTGFPSVLVFTNGQEECRFTGARPEAFVYEFIEEVLNRFTPLES